MKNSIKVQTELSQKAQVNLAIYRIKQGKRFKNKGETINGFIEDNGEKK